MGKADVRGRVRRGSIIVSELRHGREAELTQGFGF